MNHAEMLELLDYKRRVGEMYAWVRNESDPIRAWTGWRERRDVLFKEHPQTAWPAEERAERTLSYFDYDPSFRALAELRSATPVTYDIGSSDGETMRFTRVGEAVFELGGRAMSLGCFWLEGYGGGLFVPFRDETSGNDTYGGGRYVLDTVKGSDLGMQIDAEGRELLVLDFNFAYNPSCSYDPRWACPLAPPGNRLDIEIRAGEKHLH